MAGRQRCVPDAEPAGVLMTEPVWSVGVLLAVGLLGVMVLLAWVGTQD